LGIPSRLKTDPTAHGPLPYLTVVLKRAGEHVSRLGRMALKRAHRRIKHQQPNCLDVFILFAVVAGLESLDKETVFVDLRDILLCAIANDLPLRHGFLDEHKLDEMTARG
jgi:hypothetical protein